MRLQPTTSLVESTGLVEQKTLTVYSTITVVDCITNIYEKISLTVIGSFAHLMSRNYILVLCIRILKV